jgi:hypothetical protein
MIYKASTIKNILRSNLFFSEEEGISSGIINNSQQGGTTNSQEKTEALFPPKSWICDC